MPAKKKATTKGKTKKSVLKKRGAGIKQTGKAAPKKKAPKNAQGIIGKTRQAEAPKIAINDFPIIGIGASAGGLEAIEGFLAKMPSDSNMAFVFIQHLDPTHKSIMSSLLMKHTKMSIAEIEDGVTIEPNCIYLNPPNKDVAILNRTLQLMEPKEIRGTRLAIDFFFRSLSEDQGEKAVCIILSGTGTDGTLGLRAIKSAGGLAIVQEEKQARYDGMPKSAIDTGLVDFVLPVEKMPKELITYVKHPYIEGTEKPSERVEKFENYAQKIFVLIRGKTGHDFSNYKQTTIRRRIERRIAVHQISNLPDYVRYLQQNPNEVDVLFKDLLITVTSFFRDPESYEIIDKKVIPEIMKKKKSGFPLRVWVPGCASGEEVYSIAILFAEFMKDTLHTLDIQIFATDIDENAIEYARQALYPESIAADVPAEYLRKYFIKEDTFYKVRKQIREMVIFATQNLIKDPPFSKLDMVVCRNLLIYMNQVLQRKILPLFHYTLNPDGFLILGSSESIGGFTDYFKPVDSKWKIFQRKGANIERPLDYFSITSEAAERELTRGHSPVILSEMDVRRLAERVILEDYAFPCVLINSKYNVLYFHGKTDRFLSPPVGEATFNLLKMAHEDLRYKLSNALHQAVKQKKIIVCDDLKVNHNGQILSLDLVVRPIVEAKTRQELLMIVFEEKVSLERGVKQKGARPKVKKDDPRIDTLEQELQSTREYLQTTVEELETSNEELKSTNEELQSTNEELQSTNEELGTSKEELQSTNEELSTVNSELQNKLDELTHANNDLNNLISSTEVGTIFLDSNLCIKRFTTPATEIFNIIQADVGRPISDITLKVSIKDIYKELEGVLKTLNRKEHHINNKSGRWFNMRFLPYRTTDNVIDGVVITITDITSIKDAENVRRLATVVSDSNDAITVQDLRGNIITWNRGAQEMYGYTEAEAIGMNISEIIPVHNKKEALAIIKKVVEDQQLDPFETTRVTKDGRTISVWLTVTKLTDDSGKTISVATTERSISELEEVLKKLKKRE